MKKIISILLVVAMLTTLVACGNSANPTTNGDAVESNTTVTENGNAVADEDGEAIIEQENTETATDGEAIDEAVHEHEYVEAVTAEATCTESGIATFTCSCGDAYDEEIEAKGHNFGDYVADGNASYTADGTKTAKCSSCEATDTVADEGSKLSYTFTDGEAVKYAQQTVNLRSGPSTDFDKVGSLSTNDEVKVVATCNETGWYKIVWNGSEAYVSNNYLGDKKVEPPAPAPADNGNSGGNVSSGVPRAADYTPHMWHYFDHYSFYLSTEWEYVGAEGYAFHIAGTNYWCQMNHPDISHPAVTAFYEANCCNCGEPTHGGMFPWRHN